MSHQEFIQQFQVVTGCDDNASTAFLENANWNVEQAISLYFDAGEPVVANQLPVHDSVVIPPQQQQPQLQQPIVFPDNPPIEDVLEDIRSSLSSVSGNIQVPLRGIRVKVNVKGLVAQVEVLQRYKNTDATSIEAVFSFQQDDVCVYGFHAEVAGKKVIGVCKEKDEAFNAYDDAMSSGHGAYLLDQASADTFKLSVGNLPPQAECIVCLKYATTLATEGEALRLFVPVTKIAVTRSGNDDVESEAAQRVPEGVMLTAHIEMASEIIGLESEAHEIDYNIQGAYADLAIKENAGSVCREFVVLIGTVEPHKPFAEVEVYHSEKEDVVERKGKEAVSQHEILSGEDKSVMLCFYPKIDRAEEEEDLSMEYVFLIDRSGSMAGSRINQAKNALQLFIRSIPVGSLFNIVGFGSRYERLFNSSIPYNDETFQRATQYVAELKADLAGTDILPPLANILSEPPHSLFPRQLFCLTDGEVENTDDVLALLKKQAASTRIFTLGIGAEASKKLVKGMAKVAHGHAEFVASGSRIEPKVLAQLKRAMQPYYSDVRVEWGNGILADLVTQSPTSLPPIFPGDPIVIYGMLPSGVEFSALQGTQVILRANVGPNKTVQFPIVFDAPPKPGNLVHVLGASAKISETEKKHTAGVLTKQEAKDIILPLAIKYSLLSQYTSYVALEIRAVAVAGEMETRDVNDLLTNARVSGGIRTSSDMGGSHLSEREEVISVMSSAKRSRSPIKQVIPAYESLVNSLDTVAHKLHAFKEGATNKISTISSSFGGFFGAAVPNSSGARYRTSSNYDFSSESKDKAKRPSHRMSYDDEGDFDGLDDIKPSYSSLDPASPPGEMNCDSSDGEEEELKDRSKLKTSDSVMSKLRRLKFARRGSRSAELDGTKTPPPEMASTSYDDLLDIVGVDKTEEMLGSTPPSPTSSAAPLQAAYSPTSAKPMQLFARVVKKAVVADDPNRRPLDRFVLLQEASGNWTLNKQFLQTTKMDYAEISEKFGFSIMGEWFVNVVATLLALAYLKVEFADSFDEWALLHEKAMRWINREMKTHNPSHNIIIEELLQQAKSLIEDKKLEALEATVKS